MAATLPAHQLLTVGSTSYDAAIQLFYKLPGRYRLIRRSHHRHVVEDTNLSYGSLVHPSLGTSAVTLRASTDSGYEVELIQTTVINLRTWTHQTATKVEKRAFRIANGQWSVWCVDDLEGLDVVRAKMADLTLGAVQPATQGGPTGLDAEQIVRLDGGPWQDGRGRNGVAMRVWVKKGLAWQFAHQLDRQGVGASEVCSDELWPAVEGGERR